MENSYSSSKIYLKSIILSLIMTSVFVLIIGVFSYFGVLSNRFVPTMLYIVSIISLLLSSIFASRKIENKGILIGLIVGMLYFVLVFLISSLFRGKLAISPKTIIMLLADIPCGMLGGIIGANIKK